jgi:FixJ family two-component response regulator
MQSHGYDAKAFDSGPNFLTFSRLPQTDCLIADMHMPEMTGLELLGRLAQLGASIPTILITARHDEVLRERALKAGVFCYLAKPFKEEHLLNCIHSSLHKSNATGG